MKKLILFSALFLAAASAPAQFERGAYGHFTVGPAFSMASMQSYLRGADRLGEELLLPQGGVQVGGGGGLVLGSWYLGGGGSAASFSDASTARGVADARITSGFFQVGYLVYNESDWWAYPYLGIGGMTYQLELANLSPSEPLAFEPNNPLPPGEARRYRYGGFAADIGFSLRRLIRVNGQSLGPILGLDAGATVGPFGGEWENPQERRAFGPPSPVQVLWYLRITLGGGAFFQ